MKTLSSEDAFFLYMETPDQHQHVVATMILDPSTAPGEFTIDTLIDKYRQEMQQWPGFSQQLVNTPLSMTPPVLDQDPHFEFRNHIRRIAVPAPGTLQQLASIVEDIASVQLDRRRPLWECWFISGLENERLAIVFKSHHCLSDGVHGAEFMAKLFDTTAERSAHAKPGAHANSARQRKPLWLETYRALRDQQRYQPSYWNVTMRTLRSLQHRHQLFTQSTSMKDLVPAFLEGGPKLKFNTPITPNRSVAMGSASLVEIKNIKRALGITVNDVVLSACTLGLRDYLMATDDLPDKPLICYQPVSLSLKGIGSAKPDQGNDVGTMAVHLPVHIEDTRDLVQAVCEATQAAKTVFDQSFENLLQSYIGVLPSTVADWGLKHYLNRQVIKYAPTSTNLVISNIPGPTTPMYLGGALLEASYVMGPIISGQGPNITFMSYVDHIHFCVQACREQIPDSSLLSEAINRAFAQLAALASTQTATS